MTGRGQDESGKPGARVVRLQQCKAYQAQQASEAQMLLRLNKLSKPLLCLVGLFIVEAL